MWAQVDTPLQSKAIPLQGASGWAAPGCQQSALHWLIWDRRLCQVCGTVFSCCTKELSSFHNSINSGLLIPTLLCLPTAEHSAALHVVRGCGSEAPKKPSASALLGGAPAEVMLGTGSAGSRLPRNEMSRPKSLQVNAIAA